MWIKSTNLVVVTYLLVYLDEFSNGVSLDREEKREIEPWSHQNQEAGEMRSKMIEVEVLEGRKPGDRMP